MPDAVVRDPRIDPRPGDVVVREAPGMRIVYTVLEVVDRTVRYECREVSDTKTELRHWRSGRYGCRVVTVAEDGHGRE